MNLVVDQFFMTRTMAQRKRSNLSGEASDSPFVMVEFSGKLAKKETEFTFATVAGDLKRILPFLGNLLAFERRMVRSRVNGLPFEWIVTSLHG